MTAQARADSITDALADHVLARGLGQASLRPLAAAAGTSDRMLLYYFPDKAALMGAVLTRIAQRLLVRLEASDVGPAPRGPEALEAAVLKVVRSEMFRPYMHVWLELAARSAREEEPYRAIGGAIAAGFLAWVAARLAIDDPDERARHALRVLTAIEGAAVLDAVGLTPPSAGG